MLLRAAAHPSGGVGNYANNNLGGGGGFVGLAIDFDTEALYWISSGNSTINRCKLDGSGLEVLEGAKGKLTKATALAIMGGASKKVVFKPEFVSLRYVLDVLFCIFQGTSCGGLTKEPTR